MSVAWFSIVENAMGVTTFPRMDRNINGLWAGWLSQQYTHSWFASTRPIWRDRARGELHAMTTHLVLALAHTAMLGAIGWAGIHGTIDLAAVTVYVGAVAGIGTIGLWYINVALPRPTAHQCPRYPRSNMAFWLPQAEIALAQVA